MVMVVVWEWAAEDQPTNVARANAALLQTAARAKRDMFDPPNYVFYGPDRAIKLTNRQVNFPRQEPAGGCLASYLPNCTAINAWDFEATPTDP
jgi:hypothetical protein